MKQSLLPDCLRYTVSYSVSHLANYTGVSPDNHAGSQEPNLTVPSDLLTHWESDGVLALNYLPEKVGVTGLEPATSTSQMWRPTHLGNTPLLTSVTHGASFTLIPLSVW